MKLSGAKTFFSAFLIILSLIFSYQHLILAQENDFQLPQNLNKLLTGKTTDFSSVAAEIGEADLPAAFAIVELLKFKAIHQEIPASIDQINNFGSQIKSRLEKSSVVSFSKTDICRKKIEAKEIKIAGQKLIIPEYYIADTDLTIIGVVPTGEAGTVFPDIQVNLFSQSNIAEYSLVIDGKAVQQNNIGTFKDGDELGLIFRPDLNSDSVLAIGTHTAEITISNEKGEIANRKWSFTVGVYDVSTPALPENATLVNEFPVSLAALFRNPEISGELTVLVYQDKTGKRYTEYRLVSSSGMITSTRNLAHISRKVLLKRSGTLVVAPALHYIFAGSRIEFSYSWSGDGSIVETGWEVITGPEKHTTPSITVAGDTCATCKLVIEHIFTDGAGNEEVFYETLTNSQSVKCITASTAIRSNRLSFLSNESSHSFKLDGKVSCNVASDLKEGQQRQIVFDEPGSPTGTLKVNRLRWVLHASEGEPVISTPTATQTALVFSKHGYAEACFEIELSWVEAGYTFTSTYKPDDSGLYAFFPVDGKLVFSKFPEGQITIGRRKIELKSFEFKIRNQTRVVEGPSDFDLSEPILLCESSLWPASSPICINKAVPLIREAQDGSLLENENNFSFTTPMAIEPGVINLSLHGRFSQTAVKNSEQDCYVSNLQAIPVYSETDLINVKLEPDELISFYEGQELEFKTALVPVAGFGTGEYSADQETLDILAGYYIPQSPTIYWYEEPLWEEDEGEWRKKARQTQDFYHLFDPTAGVGSYSMNCGFMFELVEKDTQESISIYIENSTPVDVLPGLRFLSPIEELAYPKNASIKVKTTLDAKEYQKLWDKIKWKLNDKDFTPDTDTPPFNIFLDHTGKWKLEAILTIKESEIQGGIIAKDSDEPIILKDTAEFEVKDIELSITPNRKLVEFTPGKQIEVRLEAKVGDNEISHPETPVPWQDDEMQISIDPIDWSIVTAPKDCASLLSDSQGFINICEFAGNGAATVLATVTARIIGAEKIFRKKHKAFKRDVSEEPVFTFPLKRADIWAVEPPSELCLKGQIPKIGLLGAGRTFDIASGFVQINSIKHDWAASSGFVKIISHSPAISGVKDATCENLIFRWEGPEKQSGEGSTFAPVFPATGTAQVLLHVAMDFAHDEIDLEDIPYSVDVKSLNDVITEKISPASFTFFIGQQEKFEFSFQAQQEFKDEFSIQTILTTWSQNGKILGNTNPMEYAAEKPGYLTIDLKAGFSFVESDFNPPAKEGYDLINAAVSGKIIPVHPKLKSIEFLSDHNLLMKNPTEGSEWGDSNVAYESPEWVADLRSNPISQTRNTKLIAKVIVEIEQPGLSFDLVGDGAHDYVDFEETGLVSTGGDQEITVTAKANLPDWVCILEENIFWEIKSRAFDRATSSNHKIYVTFGTPVGSKVTERRLQEVCTKANGLSSVEDCADKIFNQLVGTYNIHAPNWGPFPIWLLYEPDNIGSQCPGLADFVNKNFQMVGLGSGMIKYCRATPEGSFEGSSDSDEKWRLIGSEHPEFTTHDDIHPKEILYHWDSGQHTNNFEATCFYNDKYYALGIGVFDTPMDVVKQAFSSITWNFFTVFDPVTPANSRVMKCFEAPWVEVP